VLSELSEVDDRCRGLEAKADELFGFFGPICRNFKLNEKHQDIGFIHEVLPVTVPVRYGIVDAERERRERDVKIEREEADRVRKETETAIRALREDPQKLAIMTIRIEKRDVSGSASECLVSLMEEYLPLETHPRGGVFADFSWAFNLSNTAAPMLDDRLRARARAKTN
jgi:hypothetical protein